MAAVTSAFNLLIFSFSLFLVKKSRYCKFCDSENKYFTLSRIATTTTKQQPEKINRGSFKNYFYNFSLKIRLKVALNNKDEN